jgi:hypothetical protein
MSVLPFTVTSHLDSPTATAGDGTLRGEILAANAVGAANIDFNIEGTGVQTIVLAGIPLPTIDVPTVINGRSQGGVSYTGSPKIAISGVAVPHVNGITVDSNAAGSTIEGLSIAGFVASARTGTLMKGAAIYIAPGSNGNLIQDNYLGYIPGGDIGTPNDYGIDISSPNNTIGGTAAGAAN